MTTRSCFLLALLLAPTIALAGAGHDHGGYVASGRVNPVYVPPPPEILDRMAEKTANITVNFNPSSCPSGSTSPWSTQAREAFQYAASIWAAILNADVTIEIDACWRNDLASNVLGSAGPRTFYANFTNAPRADTFYAVALANELAGSDLNGGAAEIDANFNSSFNWYLGTDGNVALDEYDFVTTVLHEIAHGLGFTGSMAYDDGNSANGTECNGTAGAGCFGLGNDSDPMIYDRFTENLGGTLLITYANPSTTLGSQLTSDDVFFDGASANALNGGQRVELYAPTSWNGGSSYAHLAESFNGTEHALMTFSGDLAEAIHYPGRVTVGLFADLGWDLRNLSTVYVDVTYTGEEIGGPTNPFDTVGEGTKAVFPGGTVYVRPGNYVEQLTVRRAMFLRPDGGSAVIGN